MHEYRKLISSLILTAVITVLVIATSILPLTQHNAKAFSPLDGFKNVFRKNISITTTTIYRLLICH